MATDWALAANGSAAVDNGSRLGNIAAFTIDGNDATAFYSNLACNSGTPYVTITFAETHTIHVVQLKQLDAVNYQATIVEVLYSLNGVDYSSLGNHNIAGADDSWEITPLAARYWRIRSVNGGVNYWRLHTISLWDDGTSVPTPPNGSLESDAQYKLGVGGPRLQLPWLAYTQGGPLYSPEYCNFVVGMWNNYLLNQIIATLGGGDPGGGEELTLGDIATLFADQDAHNDIHFTSIYNSIGNEANAIRGLDQRNLTDVMAAIHLATDNVDGDIVNLPNKIDGISSEISTIIGLQISQLSTDLQTVIGQARDDVKAWVTLNNTPLLALVAAEFAASIAATAASAASAATNSAEIVTDWAATIPDLVDDVGQILDLLQGQGQSDTGTPEWPGVANVTFNPPWTISHADNIPGPMDGVLIDVQAVPNGQSRQAAAGSYRYKGVGWLAFMTDTNHWEPLQQIGCEHGVYVAQSLARASRVAVYCKPGTTLLIRPWTKTAV